MSRSVDLFISSALPLDRLAEDLARRAGAQALPTTDPGRWRFLDGSVSAELSEHPYVDDGELWLSRYRYALSTRMATGVGPLDSPEVLSLRHLARLLHDDALPALLVLDLQYRLEPTGTPAAESAGDGSAVEESVGEESVGEESVGEESVGVEAGEPS